MISLSQMQLLEQKIETVIAKIAALAEANRALQKHCGVIEAENAAFQEKYIGLEAEKNSLRDRCGAAEAANRALQAKLNEFQTNQSRIEQSILNALHKLDAIENTVIETVGTGDFAEDAPEPQDEWFEEEAPLQDAAPSLLRELPVEELPAEEPFESEELPETPALSEADEPDASSEEKDMAPQFDIF